MLRSMFAFSGRLKRLPYFLIGVVVFCVVWTVIGAMVASVGPQLATLDNNPEAIRALLPMLPIALLLLAVHGWISLSTQACRIRDIGWNPVIVLPAYLLGLGAGEAMAMSVHSLAPVVGFANLAMGCCLLFWPSAPGETAFGGDVMAGLGPEPAPRTPSRTPAARAPAGAALAAPMFQAPAPPEPAAQPPRFVARQPAAPPAFGRRGPAPR